MKASALRFFKRKPSALEAHSASLQSDRQTTQAERLCCRVGCTNFSSDFVQGHGLCTCAISAGFQHLGGKFCRSASLVTIQNSDDPIDFPPLRPVANTLRSYIQYVGHYGGTVPLRQRQQATCAQPDVPMSVVHCQLFQCHAGFLIQVQGDHDGSHSVWHRCSTQLPCQIGCVDLLNKIHLAAHIVLTRR